MQMNRPNERRRLSDYRTSASDLRISKWRDVAWRRDFHFVGTAERVMPARSKISTRRTRAHHPEPNPQPRHSASHH